MSENTINRAAELAKGMKIPGKLTKEMFVAFLFFGTMPLWIEGVGFYQYIAVEVLIWCIYALGYNMALGYTGLPSFGHGAYLGVGAYAMGLLQKSLGFGIWGSLIGSVFFGLLAAGCVALFISHRRGIYFALMTIAFGQIFWYTAIKWYQVTGGEDGLLNVKRLPVNLGFTTLNIKENSDLFYFVFAFFIVVVVLLWSVVHSRFGKVIQAVKQNEMRSRFIGYDVRRYKWMSFTLSGGIAGLAGGLFCLAQESAYPDVMSLHQAGLVVMMTVIGGGFVSFWGPVVGTVLYFVARDALGAATETWLLWYGLMFMLLVMFKPEGVAGIWQDWMKKLKKQKGGNATGSTTISDALRS